MQATVSNEYLTLTVDTLGAEAVSLKNRADEEMLWQADKNVWARHAPILFPWTGKLTGGSFSHKGKEYPGGQHGFARDLEHRLISAENGTIVLELCADEKTREFFPFDFILTSTYTLDGKTLHHTVTVTNPGEETLRFGIGFHPGYNVPFDESHTSADYVLRFETAENPMIIDTHPNGLLSGRCGFKWHNTNTIALSDELFADDSFCMTGLKSNTLGIYEKGSGRHIVCSIAGFPYTLIWSAPTEKLRFVCIEPWHSLPGEENGPREWSERPAAAALKTGESFTTTLSTRFER